MEVGNTLRLRLRGRLRLLAAAPRELLEGLLEHLLRLRAEDEQAAVEKERGHTVTPIDTASCVDAATRSR